MRTVIITFTHEGMKVAKKASTVTDGEVTIYCHKRCADDYREDAVSFATVGSVIKNELAMCDRILFVCAAAIAVRTIAPYLKSKVTDPAVLVADESGKFLISLLSGHIGGANEWCNELAGSIGAIPVITTATDTRGMFAVDLFAAEHNMKIVNPVMIQDISGRILNGEAVGITGDETFVKMLRETEKQWNGQITYTDNADGKYESGVQIISHPDENVVFKRTLKLVPQNLAVGIGCKKGKTAEEIEQVVKKVFDMNNLMPEAIAVAASVDRKADEQGIIEFARKFKVPYRTYTPEALREIEGDFSSSAFVNEQIGVDNVCERSACAASGGGSKEYDMLKIVGFGSGAKDNMTLEASAAISSAQLIVGYSTYVDILKQYFPDKEYYSTNMMQEKERCQYAIDMAKEGRDVVLVCSGDSGVYGMASLVYELADEGTDIKIISGVTAANSGAACLGAPLSHDFAVISLSDCMTPWELIKKRIRAMAESDMVMCIYNPSSRRRAGYLKEACDIVMEVQPADTVCGYVRNIGRDNETAGQICSRQFILETAILRLLMERWLHREDIRLYEKDNNAFCRDNGRPQNM